MTSTKQRTTAQIQLWLLVGVLGSASAGVLLYGLLRPEPPRNLADPMPVANLAPQPDPSRFASPPSASRRIAQRENEARRTECQRRHDDCSIACDKYPEGSSGRAECMGFCDRARESCTSWAHR